MKTKTVDSCKNLIGCFCINFLLSGSARLSSLFFVEFVARYDVGRKNASFPFVLSYIIRNVSGPLTGYLEQIFGVRIIVTIGSILAIVSVGSCFFAEDILTVTILWGGMFGLGFGLACQLMPLHVTRSFQSNQGKANGFAYAGCSIGAILLPPLMAFCIQVYGMSGTFLVLSALMSHCIPATLILKSTKKNMIPKGIILQENTLKTNNSSFDKIHSQKNVRAVATTESIENTNDRFTNSYLKYNLHNIEEHSATSQCKNTDELDEEKCNDLLRSEISPSSEIKNLEFEISKKNCNNSEIPYNTSLIFGDQYLNKSTETRTDCFIKKCDEIKKIEQPSIKRNYSLRNCMIFVDPVFLALIIINTGDTFILSTTSTVILDYARDKEVSRNYEIYCVMCIPFADLIGRCVVGFIVDKLFSSITKLSAMFFIFSAISYLILVAAKNIIFVLVGEFFIGISFGIIIIINILLVERYIEEDMKGMAMTCRLVMDAPANLGISPMIGYFRENLNSYDPVMYILSGISLISACAVYSIPYLAKRRRK